MGNLKLGRDLGGRGEIRGAWRGGRGLKLGVLNLRLPPPIELSLFKLAQQRIVFLSSLPSPDEFGRRRALNSYKKGATSRNFPASSVENPDMYRLIVVRTG